MNFQLDGGIVQQGRKQGSPTKRSRHGGFTLVELMTVMGLMGMLITLAMPNFIRARSSSQERICITNLNKLEWAKQMWGMENNKSLNDTPAITDVAGSGGYLKDMPICPSTGTYDLKPLREPAACTESGHTL